MRAHSWKRKRKGSVCELAGCAAEALTLGIGPASDLRVTGRALFRDSGESLGGIGEELALGGGGTWVLARFHHETG